MDLESKHDGQRAHAVFGIYGFLPSDGPGRKDEIQLSHPYMTTGKTIALTAASTAAKSLQLCPTLCDPI